MLTSIAVWNARKPMSLVHSCTNLLELCNTFSLKILPRAKNFSAPQAGEPPSNSSSARFAAQFGALARRQ
jgi:hypothetical protein